MRLFRRLPGAKNINKLPFYSCIYSVTGHLNIFISFKYFTYISNENQTFQLIKPFAVWNLHYVWRTCLCTEHWYAVLHTPTQQLLRTISSNLNAWFTATSNGTETHISYLMFVMTTKMQLNRLSLSYISTASVFTSEGGGLMTVPPWPIHVFGKWLFSQLHLA
jgi:hypothetical protein